MVYEDKRYSDIIDVEMGFCDYIAAAEPRMVFEEEEGEGSVIVILSESEELSLERKIFSPEKGAQDKYTAD